MKRLLISIVFLIAIIQSVESKTLFSSSIYSPQDTLFGARLKSPIQSERANIVCQGCSIDSDLEVDGDTYIVEDYVTIENGAHLTFTEGSTLRIRGDYTEGPVIRNSGDITLEHCALEIVIPSNSAIQKIIDLEEIVLISGPYQNDFESITPILPSVLSDCYSVKIEKNISPEEYVLTFVVTTLESDHCELQSLEDDTSLPNEKGILAGIVIACIVGVAVVVLIGFMAIRKFAHKTREAEMEERAIKSSVDGTSYEETDSSNNKDESTTENSSNSSESSESSESSSSDSSSESSSIDTDSSSSISYISNSSDLGSVSISDSS